MKQIPQRHVFYLNEDGEIDLWRLDYGFHNGPRCTRCEESFCMHCDTECFEEDCDGASVEDPPAPIRSTTSAGRWIIGILRANEMHGPHCDLLITRKDQRNTDMYLAPQPCNCWLSEEEN